MKLEYQESRHTVLDLLLRINAKVQTWKAPFGSQETVLVLLQDWHVRSGGGWGVICKDLWVKFLT